VSEGFFPQACPSCKTKLQSKGKRTYTLKSRWGESQLSLQRQACPKCERSYQALPEGLDGSGLSPRALECSLDLCTRLPYREAQSALAIQGLDLEVSHCERLTQHYGERVYQQVCATLEHRSTEPLGKHDPAASQQVQVVQIDGVYVLEKDKPSKGLCEGREVKHALTYPLAKPQERCSIASSDPDMFQQLSHGLLRHAGVRQEDKLIGVADGSRWIDALFEDLGVVVRILDVFHATGYLDTVMQALAWHEDKRLAERCSWLRGDINARVWLKHYLPEPEVWLTWSQTAQTALQYLETRLDQMDYFDFKQRGYPLGSGQIEGANKSVIGARMKRGGMRWSYDGINRMAMLRSEQCSFQPVTDFQQTRLLAFPAPQL
jgi:hypothetical protein